VVLVVALLLRPLSKYHVMMMMKLAASRKIDSELSLASSSPMSLGRRTHSHILVMFLKQMQRSCLRGRLQSSCVGLKSMHTVTAVYYFADDFYR